MKFDETTGKTIWQAMRNNRNLKLVALLLAALSWYAIREFTSFTTVVRQVHVEVLVGEGWAVFDRSVEAIDVVCRGSQSDIRYLTRDQLKVTVDLRGKSHPGTETIAFKPKDISVPGGARAISTDPADITLTLDREGDRMVRVRADIVGTPPEGYEVAEVTCTPSEVRLQGPQGRLAELQEIKTAAIDLEGRVRSFSLTRAVQPPSELWSTRVEPDRTRVDVRIVERSSTLDVPDIAVKLLVWPNTPPIRFLDPNPRVKVSVRGRADAIHALSATNMTPLVDCTVLKSGEIQDLPIRVYAPAGVEILAQEPSHLRVEAP